MRRPETFDLSLEPPFCAGVASRPTRQAAPRPAGLRFFPAWRTPPGRCAPCGEGIIQAPGLHDPFPARPDDPDERLAITQNGGSRLKLRRGLAQPVPGAAGTSTSLWGTQAKRSGTRHSSA